MPHLHQTTIRFPEIQLTPRYGHKLRGYFGQLFQEHAPLLNNHYDSGKLRHRYPLVQYKVIDKTPTLVALEKGAELMTNLFLDINKLELEGKTYPVRNKYIENRNVSIGYSDQLHEYQFQTLWMALNQENYAKYKETSKKEQTELLERIIIGNVLSFYKNMDLRLSSDEQLMSKVFVKEKTTNFKNQKMMAFTGQFVMNAQLPDQIGLGKAVSRGFGTIKER